MQLLSPIYPSFVHISSILALPSFLKFTAFKFFTLLYFSIKCPRYCYLPYEGIKSMKNGVFWDVTPCGSCKNRRFGGTWRLLHQGEKNR
jgi:hypothetical protein